MFYTLAADNPGLTELFPLLTGTEECAPGHLYGPAVREYYLMHYIHGGTGSFASAAGSWKLGADDGFFLFPNEVATYRASQEDPWRYTWIGFSGTAAESLLASVGVTRETPVIRSAAAAPVFAEVRAAHLCGDVRALGSGLRVLSWIYGLFEALRPAPVDRHAPYVRSVQDAVEKLYASHITVEDLARSAGLDRRYLCRLFKAETGQTLRECLVGTRLRHARRLLCETKLTVREVASSVGYEDPCNFSRMYRRYFGFAPSERRGDSAG